MLSTRDARVARKVKRRISEIAEVKRLVVDGSRARGNPGKYLDLDLYIELNASERLKGQPILKAIRAEGIAV